MLHRRTGAVLMIYRQDRSAMRLCNPAHVTVRRRTGEGLHPVTAQAGGHPTPRWRSTCREPLGAGVVRRIVPVPPAVVGHAGCAVAEPSPGRPCWCAWGAGPATP